MNIMKCVPRPAAAAPLPARLLLTALLLWVAVAAQAQISLVQATIESNPGTVVGLDGETSENNIIKREIIAGPHIVTVLYNGLEVKRDTVDVPSEPVFRHTVNVAGKVRFESTPEATLTLDGEEVGVTPLEFELLGPHWYEMKYKNNLYKPVKREDFTANPLTDFTQSHDLIKRKHAYEWRWHLLAQAAFPTSNVADVSPGIMIAFAKVVGFYFRLHLSPTLFTKTVDSYVDPDDGRAASGIWNDGAKPKVGFGCGGIGLIYNIIRPLNVYAGCSFGTLQEYRKDIYGENIRVHECESAYPEAGLMFCWKRLSVNAGVSYGITITDGGCNHGKFVTQFGIGVSI